MSERPPAIRVRKATPPFSKIIDKAKYDANPEAYEVWRDPLDHDGDGRRGGSLTKDQRPQKLDEPPPAGIGTNSGDQFSDEQLRAAITEATGKAPHHKLGREKLVETFNALNAKGADE